ncbi:hypothetical protein [Nocardioides sp. SYSU DS0663]|uniref:hypothetical protein n=1 Tax=Nocardioides sp. SYSU DS0663 TaxID=3416445 RepID=UPI003F4BE48A
MSTLHDRLVDLAGEAGAAVDGRGAVPGSALWARGRRYARRRRALAVAAVVAVVAGSGTLALAVAPDVTGDRPAPVSPVPLDEAVLPDRLGDPPAWLLGTDEAGLPGRLSAIVGGERGTWTGPERALAGVSAADGSLVWLDLPADAVPGVSPGGFSQLSPDGRRVVFWTTGETGGLPASRDEEPVTGVAVWDAATGEVVRHDIPTEHGLHQHSLGWVDEETVVLHYGHIVGGYDDIHRSSSSRGRPPEVWVPGSTPERLQRWSSSGWLAGAADGRLVVGGGPTDGSYRWTDTRGRRLTPWLQLEPMGSGSVAVSDDLGAVASLPGNRNPAPLAVGDVAQVAARGRSALRPVAGGERTSQMLGWLDESTVAAVRWRTRDGIAGPIDLVRHDVRSGSVERVTTFPAHTGGGSDVHFAEELLTAPSVEPPEPQTRTDPRLLTGAGLALVLAALGVLLWRRHARP